MRLAAAPRGDIARTIATRRISAPASWKPPLPVYRPTARTSIAATTSASVPEVIRFGFTGALRVRDAGMVPPCCRRRGPADYRKCSAAAGGTTQACMRSSYTDTVGAGKRGSANAPTGMLT